MLAVTGVNLKNNVYQRKGFITPTISSKFTPKSVPLDKDTVSLSFKGIAPEKLLHEDCQKLAQEVLEKFPAHIKQRITDKIDQIIISDTLAKALDGELEEKGSTLYEELPPVLMNLGDELRNALPKPYLQLIDVIATDKKTFEALPKGQSQLLLGENKNEAQTQAITLVDKSGKDITLPQEVTDILYLIRDLELKDNQKEAFLRSLTGASDESDFKGFSRADEAKEVQQIDEAEKEGHFAMLELGENKYTLYLSTYNGNADKNDVEASIAKSFATILIKDFNLDFNRNVAESFDRDIRVHNVHRAIDEKLKGAQDGAFSSLRKMRDLLTVSPSLSNKPDSYIGLEQASIDVITDMFIGINRHDSNDKELISRMYPTLSTSIKNVFNTNLRLLES